VLDAPFDVVLTAAMAAAMAAMAAKTKTIAIVVEQRASAAFARWSSDCRKRIEPKPEMWLAPE